MTREVFDVWSRTSTTRFADQQVAAGLASPAAATAYAREQLAVLLPDGPATPTHLLWTVHLDEDGPGAGPAIGSLWVRVRAAGVRLEATVLDIEVEADLRGRGLGRATMLAALQAAEERGAATLRLTVFGHNTPALALYDSLGFTVDRALLTRDLQSGPRARRPPTVTLAATVDRDLPPLLAAAGRPGGGGHGRDVDRRHWVAWDGGRRVGWLGLRVDRTPGPLDEGGRRVVVDDLRVLPELRGRGYGRALVDAAEVESRELGATAMTVVLTGSDARLRDFYERVGLVLTAQRMARPMAGRSAGRRSPRSG